MTFALFFTFFIILFFGLLNILPVVTSLPTGFVDGLTLIIGYMKAWNFLFPIYELFIAVSIIVVFELAVVFFKFVNWTISKVRGTTSGS